MAKNEVAASVVDATARFKCARLGHEPTLRIITPMMVGSIVCPCARCGRVIEFKRGEPINVG